MEDYLKKSKQIENLANDPDALSSHIDLHLHNLHESLPMTSQSFASNIASGIQYLNSKIPRPSNPLPLSKEFQPSEAQKQKFNRHYEAVNNPIDILAHVKKGTLTSDHMEALQTVHPQLLYDMRKRFIDMADPEKARKLPYHVQKSISMFMGSPLRESMTPQVALANQAIYKMNQMEKQAMQGAPVKSTQKGLSSINAGQMAATDVTKQEIGKPSK